MPLARREFGTTLRIYDVANFGFGTLAHNGTYILENMNTAALAADKGYEFLFVLGPARITGAVQAIINPIAIR